MTSVSFKIIFTVLKPNSYHFTACLEHFCTILFIPECRCENVTAYAISTILDRYSFSRATVVRQKTLWGILFLCWDFFFPRVFFLEFYSFWGMKFPWSVAIRPGYGLQRNSLLKNHKDLIAFSDSLLPIFLCFHGSIPGLVELLISTFKLHLPS